MATSEFFRRKETKALKTSDFYYDLPQELIAQTPLERRDGSRLMVMDKATGALQHRHFFDIVDYLRPGDCLVMNDSRVIPARLLGHRPTGGAVELLLLRDLGDGVWECLTRPGRKNAGPGTSYLFGNGELTAEVIRAEADGNRCCISTMTVSFLSYWTSWQNAAAAVYQGRAGRQRALSDGIFPRAALPPPLRPACISQRSCLSRSNDKGVKLAYVTLHVGLGTFRPVKAEEITEHHMHSEFCMISAETAQILNETKQNGGRIVCVGTTSCRTVESLAKDDGSFAESSAWTDIYIYPGYRFKVMDALITNFHLPQSTLIMLVSALAGREHVL